MTSGNRLFCAVFAAAVVTGGCVVTATPGQGTHKEWAGAYARKQAARKDADREIARRVSRALDGDPDLEKLDLRYFVKDGEVSLCGPFPDPRMRARAQAVVAGVKGVSGVDFDCRD